MGAQSGMQKINSINPPPVDLTDNTQSKEPASDLKLELLNRILKEKINLDELRSICDKDVSPDELEWVAANNAYYLSSGNDAGSGHT